MNHYSSICIPNTKGDLTESLLWDDRSSEIVWADVFEKTLHKFNPLTGQHIKKTFDSIITSIVKRKTEGYLLAAGNKIVEIDGSLEFVNEIKLEMPNQNVRTNDGAVDQNGIYWLGSMAYDAKEFQGDLKQINSKFDYKTIITGTTISNGMDWSSNNNIFYFIDTPTRKIGRFEYDSEKSNILKELSPILLDGYEGVPDGMCVDAENNLWVAFWGGSCVRNFSPEGELIGHVSVNASLVSNCAFGGKDLKTLYISTANPRYDTSIQELEPEAGSIFKCEVGVKGRIQNSFGK